MSFPHTREFLNSVDENGDKKGVILPCDVFKHLRQRGMDPVKSALTAGLLSVMGGIDTNPIFPIFSKNTRNIDNSEIFGANTMLILKQVLILLESFIVPQITKQLNTNNTSNNINNSSNKPEFEKNTVSIQDIINENKNSLYGYTG